MAFARLGDSERAWELARMINPVSHALDADAIDIYKVEPYVLAADVYAVAPHVGRGGWTWYTGSAGWMYRLLTESLLGLRRHGKTLHVEPCIPRDWPGYSMQYRFGGSAYRIEVEQVDGGDASLVVDDVAQPALAFALVDDRSIHQVKVRWPRTGA